MLMGFRTNEAMHAADRPRLTHDRPEGVWGVAAEPPMSGHGKGEHPLPVAARAVHAIEPGELENIPMREAVLCDHVPPS